MCSRLDLCREIPEQTTVPRQGHGIRVGVGDEIIQLLLVLLDNGLTVFIPAKAAGSVNLETRTEALRSDN